MDICDGLVTEWHVYSHSQHAKFQDKLSYPVVNTTNHHVSSGQCLEHIQRNLFSPHVSVFDTSVYMCARVYVCILCLCHIQLLVIWTLPPPPKRSINAEQQCGMMLYIESVGVKIKGLLTKARWKKRACDVYMGHKYTRKHVGHNCNCQMEIANLQFTY